MRRLSLFILLAACGAPGSDKVFTSGGSSLARTDSTAKAAVPPPPAAPQPVTKPHGGYYRRVGDDSQFQPCGTRIPLEVTGSPVARSLLKERFRWNNVWEGTKMYAVLQGAVVTDTPSTAGADTLKVAPRTRFFVIAVDSLRPWKPGDCNGMRVG